MANSSDARTTRDPKPTSERITKLAGRVLDGDIVLPEFQRPFVWKRPQILRLLDSVYRNYPIGSLLVWESSQELRSKRSIADLEVAPRSTKYPVNYLLDGQQRLSTICGALNWEPGDPHSVWNLYFNLETSRFHHADHAGELPLSQIPLRLLGNPSAYFQRVSASDNPELQQAARYLFDRFTDYQVPLVTLGDMSIEDVAPVFERINSTGTSLTIYDLMRAATWSTTFDLGAKLDAIKADLEPKRYHSIENKTLLRALGAAAGGDFSASSIDQLRDRTKTQLEIASATLQAAALRAADFLATEISAPRAESLPYANQFAVLCEVFVRIPTPDSAQLEQIRYWFWRTTLSNYFGGWNNSQMSQDAKDVRQFAKGAAKDLPFVGVLPTASLWRVRPFRSNSAASKMLGLVLAYAAPLDLINGQTIDVDKSLAWSNDKEFHHFFPQNYLAGPPLKGDANVVGNIVLLTSASNIHIRDKAPSEYLSEVIERVGLPELVRRLATNLVPEDALEAALADDYAMFLARRGAYLQSRVMALTGLRDDGSGTQSETVTTALDDDSSDEISE